MNKKGFTLIELLATISILIIIVSIAVPSILTIKDRNIEKIKIKDTELIENAAEAYFEIYKGKIENIDDLYNEGICLPLKYIIKEKLVKVPTNETGNHPDLNTTFILLKKENGTIIYKYNGCFSENITFRSWEQ